MGICNQCNVTQSGVVQGCVPARYNGGGIFGLASNTTMNQLYVTDKVRVYCAGNTCGGISSALNGNNNLLQDSYSNANISTSYCGISSISAIVYQSLTIINCLSSFSPQEKINL